MVAEGENIDGNFVSYTLLLTMIAASQKRRKVELAT